MTRATKIYIGLGTLITAGIVGVWIFLLPNSPRTAPAITLTLSTGQPLNLEDLRGRPVLINFWSLSCQPCLEEIPLLSQIYHAWRPQGLELIAIAMAYDPPATVAEFAKRLPYPVALDMESAAAHAFGDIVVVPTSFLIAADGRLVWRQVGKLEEKELKQTLHNLLAAPAPAVVSKASTF